MESQIPILIHPPKTGGTSLYNGIISTYGENSLPHPPGLDLDLLNLLYADEKNQLTLNATHCTSSRYNISNREYALTVRNPYTRAISTALFVQRHHGISPPNLTILLRALYKQKSPSSPYGNPCSFWHTPDISYTIRYESFRDDIRDVYKFDIDKHAHIYNTGARRLISDVCEFYDKPLLSLVNAMYHNDFEFYGYTKFETVEDMKYYAATVER